MDIHRCRFVHYPPSTINALAFSHSQVLDDRQTAPPRLAVGRANGDIEIWNPLNGSWFQEMTIRGGKGRSIDGLVWVQDPDEDVHGSTIIGKSRLFSIGYTTTVTEWDLEKGRPLRQAGGTHGEIWCLAAQPPVGPAKDKQNGVATGQWQGQHLIAGCTDGALVLYSTKDEDLQLQRVLIRPSSKKAKVISVTFQDRNIVIAGCSDSTIRIYDIRSGSPIRSMSLGQGPLGGPKSIIVWSVKTLKDGTIVSGDSTGELKLWDGKTYTLRQRIKSHRQDILSLATNSDGSSIISGGMDRRTVLYKQTGKAKRWAEVSHRRYHDHDVKAMASFEGKGMSVVVSGGPDASPTVLPLSQFAFENQRALPFLPQESIIQSAPRKRLVMSWWEREVYIWRLGKFSKSLLASEDTEEPTSRTRKLVAKILIKGEANITSASLSTDGDLLAVSTSLDVKVFQLRLRRPEEGDGLKVSKVTVPPALSSGARLIQFSPDGKWLCIVRPDSQIAIARVTSPGTSSASSSPTIVPRLLKLSRIDRHIEKSILLGGLGSYDRTVVQVAYSSDSRILAVSDIAGYIDTFVLSGHEDLTRADSIEDDDAASSSESSSSDSDSDSEGEEKSKPRTIFGEHWTRNPFATLIPRLPSTPVVLSFRPTRKPAQKVLTNGLTPHETLSDGEDRLLVVTATGEVFEFEALKGSLSAWSRRNPTSVFPEEFRKNRDQVKGCLWHVSQSEERVWLYGVGWLWMFDLSVDFSPPPNAENGTAECNVITAPSKKRKRTQGKEPSTGAGSAIPDHELGTGISRKMERVVHEESAEHHDIHINNTSPDAMDIDSEEEHSTLDQLRHEKPEQQSDQGRETQPEGHWHTYKYRPIVGMAVIGGEGRNKLEVAVVERPIWEVDLPPRWDGDQEWENNGVDAL